MCLDINGFYLPIHYWYSRTRLIVRIEKRPITQVKFYFQFGGYRDILPGKSLASKTRSAYSDLTGQSGINDL